MFQLSDETTLSEQCIQGEGLVQVNLELKAVNNADRINIIDVLKPQLGDVANDQQIHSGNVEEPVGVDVPVIDSTLEQNSVAFAEPEIVAYQGNSSNVGVQTPLVAVPTGAPIKAFNRVTRKLPSPQNENITRWVMDGNFRKEQERLKIPFGNLTKNIVLDNIDNPFFNSI